MAMHMVMLYTYLYIIYYLQNVFQIYTNIRKILNCMQNANTHMRLVCNMSAVYEQYECSI